MKPDLFLSNAIFLIIKSFLQVSGFKQLAVICFLLLCSEGGYARNNGNSCAAYPGSFDACLHTAGDSVPTVWRPCISPFIELLGKGFFSLNVDFRRKESHSFSIGVAGIEEGWSPNVMYYHFSGKRHRFEAGGGLSGNFQDGSAVNMVVHGVVGYRYQKKKGLLFRAGFTPMLIVPFSAESKIAFIPWAGVSLGYCF
ncbi:MAG TPA: hypothetical protein P5338_11340 [Bacteroidales bacterium]|nr:hypothetical protein [Bacteroidales bacterium]